MILSIMIVGTVKNYMIMIKRTMACDVSRKWLKVDRYFLKKNNPILLCIALLLYYYFYNLYERINYRKVGLQHAGVRRFGCVEHRVANCKTIWGYQSDNIPPILGSILLPY